MSMPESLFHVNWRNELIRMNMILLNMYRHSAKEVSDKDLSIKSIKEALTIIHPTKCLLLGLIAWV